MNHENKYLYHYTNINSLALILKNRNIKFNSLLNLDDLEESKTDDKKMFSKYCYISSWTSDKKESIPMWNLYTDLKSGVRIKLPTNPFKKYYLDKDIIKRDIGSDISIKGQNYSLISSEVLFNNNYYLATFLNNNILYKVKYTEDKSKIYPKILETETSDQTIKFRYLGKYKNNYWDFQKEWRYILIFFPFGFHEMEKYNIESYRNEIIRKLRDCVDLPFKNYYLQLDNEKFKEMEILLSPKINEGYKIIVEMLVKKYNPNAKIRYSKLTNKIR